MEKPHLQFIVYSFERHKASFLLLVPSPNVLSSLGWGYRQELGIQSRSPAWSARNPFLGPSAAAWNSRVGISRKLESGVRAGTRTQAPWCGRQASSSLGWRRTPSPHSVGEAAEAEGCRRVSYGPFSVGSKLMVMTMTPVDLGQDTFRGLVDCLRQRCPAEFYARAGLSSAGAPASQEPDFCLCGFESLEIAT